MLPRQRSDEVHDIQCIILQDVLRDDRSENVKILGILLHPDHIHVLPGPALSYWSHNQGIPQDCFNCCVILHLLCWVQGCTPHQMVIEPRGEKSEINDGSLTLSTPSSDGILTSCKTQSLLGCHINELSCCLINMSHLLVFPGEMMQIEVVKQYILGVSIEQLQDLYIPRSIISQDALEDYAQYVMDFTTSLSRQHGWLQCLTPRNHS